ncbi:MAG TPA: GNAT family N-acetyltransferase [Flavisolibacter sp.]|nr:GNAT family N-acetyltransferase [Flavisolibacter sp.]
MAVFHFTPFPDLETERLRLRQLSDHDDHEIFLLRSDEAVNKYIDRPRATSLADVQTFIQKINAGIMNNKSLYWAVCMKDKPGLIGTVCLWNLSAEEERAELGYELLPQYQGNGYMQEAILSVIQYGFQTIQLKTIDAWLHEGNDKSIRLLEKNNFKRNRSAEAGIPGEEQSEGLIIYSLKNSAFGNE